MTTLFGHILIPVDFSEKNEVSIRVAIELAKQNNAHVTLLHVVEAIENVDDELEEFLVSLEVRAEKELEPLTARFEEADITARSEVLRGKRAQEVVQFCDDRQVDLVVISSHQMDPQQPAAGFGTLSHQISIFCPCPVMLVK